MVRAGGHYVSLSGVSFGVPLANGNGTINFVGSNGGTDFNNVALSTSAAPGFVGAICNNQTYVPGTIRPSRPWVRRARSLSPAPAFY
jgi:hypothetical protein